MNLKLAAVLARQAALSQSASPGDGTARALSVTAICRELGISRDTFYVARERFAAEGLAGLLPRSRKPHHSPNRTADAVEDAVVRWRKQLADDGWDNGALSIAVQLQREGLDAPSTATINRILSRRGLVAPQPQKRPRASYRRFEFTERNGCWQIDAFCWHLADCTEVSVFEVLDDASRLELEALAAPGETGEAANACFLTAVDRHGPPAMLLTDNGVAFSGRLRGWASALEQTAATLGVRTVTSRPYHPQTCGKNERAHQTCKKWLSRQPAAETLAELQAQLDRYRELYNTTRPHQALGGRTPSQAASHLPTATPAPDTPPAPPNSRVTQHRVSSVGQIRVSGCDISLGRPQAGLVVTAVRTGDDVAIFDGHTLLRELTLDRNRQRKRKKTAEPQP